jgi:hypothetical protein
VSPPEINYNGKVRETICNDIYIETNNQELIGNDLWNEKGQQEKLLTEYKLNSERLNIEINYPKIIYVEKNKTIQICINAKEKGKYNGLILYKIKDKPIQIGVWINADIEGNDLIKINNRITGKSIANTENIKFNHYLLFITFILLMLLFIFIKKLKKKQTS